MKLRLINFDRVIRLLTLLFLFQELSFAIGEVLAVVDGTVVSTFMQHCR